MNPICGVDCSFPGDDMESRIDKRKFNRVTRRELLKLAPVLAIGAFAIPKLQEPLLKAGLGFSDWASARLFRSGHLAPTFDNSYVQKALDRYRK